jgi:hypothetical protein
MKMLTAFLFACFLATAFSQSDSVYLYSLKTILSPAHLVASPKGEVYIVEVYHSFKNNYWFSAWDTLSQAELSERTKKMVVRHLTDCDSLVNHIRNEAYLDLKTLEMNDYAREKLSYRNN